MTAADEAGDESNKFLLKNQPFLKPVLNPAVFTLDGLDNLCETIKTVKPNLLASRGVDSNWGFPGELTTCCRILLHLGVVNVIHNQCRLPSLICIQFSFS